MEIVTGVLILVLWAAVVLMVLYYIVLSIYTCKPVSSAIQKGAQGTDKLNTEQQISFLKSHLRSMKTSLLVQSVLAVSIGIALLFLGYQWVALACALLSAIQLFDYYGMQIEKRDIGTHNNGLIRCLSVIPVHDVDMNEVDKKIDKQLAEMEKKRRKE